MNSDSSSSSGSPELINGLKFGQKIYFEDVGIGVPAKSCGGSSSSSAGLPPPAPAKKGGVQQPQPPAQPPRCQVEGCRVDLSDVKAYYSRHKVCGMHSKSPMVIVAGLEQRFCQQCSRFHRLPEFDQGKRSCRRRLAGHNERRRKPPPRSLLSVPYGNLTSSSTVGSSSRRGFVMDFSSYPSLNGRNPWPTTPPITANPASYSGPTGHFADSNCALSLLSNHSYGSPTRLVTPTTYFPNPVDPVCAPPDHFLSSSSWGGNGSAHMHPDTGLGHMANGGGQYCGELEWGPQQNEHARAYDSNSTSHHIDWSL